ncbi:oxidoreductase [Malassezia pachydermatis]
MSDFKAPFTLDTIVNFLDVVPFSAPFLVILPLAALVMDRRGQSVSQILTNLPTLRGWYELLSKRHVWLYRIMIVVVLRLVSKRLSRRAINLGVPKADRPNWKKDVMVITGGATGIGKVVVELVSRRYGGRIAVLDVAEPTYAPAANGAPEILYVRTDVTKAESIAAAHEKIKQTFGESPSIVVSCAGIAIGGSILDVSTNAFRRTFEINALANVNLAKEFLPFMVKNNHGHYMTVASSASYYSLPMLGPYSLSKAAALAFHETLRAELRAVYNAPRVRTSIVTPTKVKTLLGYALKDTKNQFINRVLEPIEVATAMVDALDSGLGHSVSQPWSTKILPFIRAMPEWFRSFIAATGDTDQAVTAESIASGLKAGYGKSLGAEFSDVFNEMASRVCMERGDSD